MHVSICLLDESSSSNAAVALTVVDSQLGLIRAADTRMAGYFIAFFRMIRVKDALVSTVASPEWKDYRPSSSKQRSMLETVEHFIHNNRMWEGLVILCETIFPCVRVLCLADRNEPAFDRLYYFVLRAK